MWGLYRWRGHTPYRHFGDCGISLSYYSVQVPRLRRPFLPFARVKSL